MKLDEIIDRFHNFEVQHIKAENWEAWEVVRFDLSCIVLGTTAEIDEKNTVPKRSIRCIIEHTIKQIRALNRRSRIWIFSCSRFQNEDGKNYDPNIMDLIDLIDEPILCIDSISNTNSYSYPVVWNYLLPLFKKFVRKNDHTVTLPEYVLDRFEAEFNCKIDREKIRQMLVNYILEKKYYNWLLRKYEPKVIFLVQNGIQKGLFKAAQMQNIPVVELQHGLIDKAHIAYSYPMNMENRPMIIPRYFFSYSSFWTQRVYYPVDKIIISGNTYASKIMKEKPVYDLLFISADIYSSAINRYVDSLLSEKYAGRICLKLHPNQLNQKKEIIERYGCYDNVTVVYTEIPVKQLIGQSRAIVVVQSTCVYEALDADVPVFIIKGKDYMIHADVFNHPLVTLVDSPKKLLNLPEKNKNEEHRRYFEPFDKRNVSDFLKNELKLKLKYV